MNNDIMNASTKPVLSAVSSIRSFQPVAESSSVHGADGQVEANAKPAADQATQDARKQSVQNVPLASVKDAAATGNSIMQATNRNLEFQVDDSTRKVVVKIVDSQNGKVLRQIPSEEMLALIDKMQQLEGEKGSVLQERA